MKRKWLSASFLAGAILMLVLGLTVFDAQLKGYRFVFYWLGCLVLTGLAGLASLLELLVIRRNSLKAQRDLIEETLDEVARERQRPDQS